MTTSQPRLPSRWVCFAGLWLFLTMVFTSQLYWAGHIRPWSRAFQQESIFWLSWALIAPIILRACQRFHARKHSWPQYIGGLLIGAVIVSVIQTTVGQSLRYVKSCLAWLLAYSLERPVSFLPNLPDTAIKAAGWNFLIFGVVVLGWHSATYYRGMRDREVKAIELESLLHQSQLQALRNQLNPHFLFNTLHSIAELVHRSPRLAEQLIVRLGELLRKVLESSGEQEVTLAEELSLTRAYLEIEQMRLGEQLQVQWEVAPNVLEAKVPTLILQPLVENAVQHGIAPSDETGTLMIGARRENGFLHLRVRDSGPGLPPDFDRRGIGLSNTRARLERLYCGNHGMELTNDHGLIVNIRIPVFSTPEPGA